MKKYFTVTQKTEIQGPLKLHQRKYFANAFNWLIDSLILFKGDFQGTQGRWMEQSKKKKKTLKESFKI